MKTIIKVINDHGEIQIFNELPKDEQEKIRHNITNRLIEAFAKESELLKLLKRKRE
jgi:hypothetical protein